MIDETRRRLDRLESKRREVHALFAGLPDRDLLVEILVQVGRVLRLVRDDDSWLEGEEL